jgi:hypothetical protein
MTIEQTVEIPAGGVLHLDIALPETAIAESRARVLIQIPVSNGKALIPDSEEAVPAKSKGQIKDEAFRRALRRAYGAWEDKPWENAIEDIRAMRDEWGHRDPWNPDPAKRHTEHG